MKVYRDVELYGPRKLANLSAYIKRFILRLRALDGDIIDRFYSNNLYLVKVLIDESQLEQLAQLPMVYHVSLPPKNMTWG